MIWKLLGKHYGNKRDFKRAAKYLYKAKGSLTSVEEIQMLAESLHNIGESDKAIAYLSEMIAQYPDSSSLYERRAHILREMYREEESVADLDKAIQIDDSNYIVWYTRALAYKDLGKYEEAIRDFKESIQREDESTVVSTYYELGMAYYQNGQYREASENFRKTIHTPQAVPTYFYMLSKSLDAQGQTEEAIQILLEGIPMIDYYESQPDKGYGHFASISNYSYGAFKTFRRILAPTYSFRAVLFEFYRKLGDEEQAMDMINQAIGLFPGESDLYLMRGNLNLQQRMSERALEDYKEVIRLEPTLIKGYYQIAMAYRQMDREEEALNTFLELHRKEPSPVACYWLADSYYRLDRAEEALRINEQLLEMEDDDPLNYMQLGEIMIKLHRFREAEQAFGQAIEQNDHAEARYRKSFALYMQGKFEEAMAELQESEKLDPDKTQNPSYHMALGQIYKAMGDWQFAVDAYSKSIELDSEYLPSLQYRAECYLELSDFYAAVTDCSKAIRIHAEEIKLYQMRSYAYYRLQNYSLARKDIFKIIQLEPESASGYGQLGKVYYEERDYEEALTYLKKAVELDPTYASSYLYQAYIYFNRYDIDECVECIVRWALNEHAHTTLLDKRNAIEALEGFDVQTLKEALTRINEVYGEAIYLS